jgi:hypothetical protein
LSNVQLLVSGVIVANPRTGEDGSFTTSIYMPLTGEGPTSISAFDETGNAATASFYTEFGFDTLQRSLDEINQQIAGQTTPGTTGPATSTAAAGTPTAGTVSPPFGTPSGSPVAAPFGTPVALPFGTPVSSSGQITTSSGEPPLTVSSGVEPSRFAIIGAFALIALLATAGVTRWRRQTRIRLSHATLRRSDI